MRVRSPHLDVVAALLLRGINLLGCQAPDCVGRQVDEKRQCRPQSGKDQVDEFDREGGREGAHVGPGFIHERECDNEGDRDDNLFEAAHEERGQVAALAVKRGAADHGEVGDEVRIWEDGVELGRLVRS